MADETTTQTTTETEPSLEDFNQVAEPAKAQEAQQPAATATEPAKQQEPAAATSSKTEPAKTSEQQAEVDIYADLGKDVPEGVTIYEEGLKEFKEIAKRNNLSAEDAKAIFNLQAKAAQKQMDDFKNLQKSWEDASKVVYGENLKNVETNCSRVLAELDKDGKFKELLALVGAEKHPATFGFLKAVGDKLLEKPAVNPNATVTGEDKEPELEDFN